MKRMTNNIYIYIYIIWEEKKTVKTKRYNKYRMHPTSTKKIREYRRREMFCFWVSVLDFGSFSNIESNFKSTLQSTFLPPTIHYTIVRHNKKDNEL
mmetsp:Transcript_49299/g.55804  ORF Transcript_49299/g.55804 Transcript_49299/m.55804 type:complete len:96 (+) Transcript_49299:484-771(+)